MSEGFSYFSLSSRYSQYKEIFNPHDKAFNEFCNRLERIIKVTQTKEIQTTNVGSSTSKSPLEFNDIKKKRKSLYQKKH